MLTGVIVGCVFCVMALVAVAILIVKRYRQFSLMPNRFENIRVRIMFVIVL